MYVPDDDNYVVDGENYAPVRPENKKTPKGRFPVKKIIIIVCAIIFGIVVYFVSDMIFNGSSRNTNDTPNLATTLSVDDPEVEALYEMVTYGRDDSTLNKYLKEQFVRAEDFSNYEKFYYSFSGLRNRDLEKVEDGTYAISESTVDQLMQDYFGDDISAGEDIEQGEEGNMDIDNAAAEDSNENLGEGYLRKLLNENLKRQKQITKDIYKRKTHYIDILTERINKESTDEKKKKEIGYNSLCNKNFFINKSLDSIQKQLNEVFKNND